MIQIVNEFVAIVIFICFALIIYLYIEGISDHDKKRKND